MAVKRRPHRIGKADLDVFVAVFKCHGNTGQRAAGANCTDEAIHRAVGLFPDFRAGGVDMALTVGDVIELVGPDGTIWFGFCQFFGQTTRHMDIVVLIAIGDRRDFAQISTQQTQKVFLFLTLRFRDDNHRAITQRIADNGQTNAGIASGSFDDDAARFQKTAFFRVTNDGKSSAVFDRSARIGIFRLAQNGAARQLGNFFKFHKRGATNGFDGAIANVHDRLQAWLNLNSVAC